MGLDSPAFISAFSIMVTVTLMKTAVAKNLSQSIIICVEHQNFSKSIRQSCQYCILGRCPGIPWLPLRDATVTIIRWKNHNVSGSWTEENLLVKEEAGLMKNHSVTTCMGAL